MKKIFLVPAALAVLSIVISCNKDGGSGGGSDAPFVPKVGQTIPAWEEGVFDIHFINTPASGEATFLIYPDGTQMLIDAAGSIQATGVVSGKIENTGIRQRWEPAGIEGKTKDADVTFNFGNFIAEYIRHCQQWTGRSKIDYVMLTHLHNDHFGGINSHTQTSKDGKFRLQSLAFILDRFDVGLISDRGYPSYNYPFILYNSTGPSNWENVANWKKAVEAMVSKGVKAEMFDVGSTTQFAPAVNKGKYNFTALNIGVNGTVWTGSEKKATFPAAKDIICKDHKNPAATENCPEENHCSAVMKFSYGKFDYYASADMQYDGMSSFSWKDVDATMAKSCGVVDVMKAGHHGTTNTNGTKENQALRYLQPRCIIYCGWTDGHPREDTFTRVGDFRGNITDHYITNSCAAMKAYPKYNPRVKGDDGHVVVRVAPGGDKYYVCMVTDSDGTYTVKSVNEYNSK